MLPQIRGARKRYDIAPRAGELGACIDTLTKE
jgi:hypothetical protein